MYRQVHMGMQVRIVLYAAAEDDARQAAAAAFAEIARLDAVFSDYRSDSELSRLVERAGQAPVPVSPDLSDVLGRRQQLAEQTGGAFDITAGALTRLWRAAIRDGKVPGAAERRAAMATPESRATTSSTVTMPMPWLTAKASSSVRPAIWPSSVSTSDIIAAGNSPRTAK